MSPKARSQNSPIPYSFDFFSFFSFFSQYLSNPSESQRQRWELDLGRRGLSGSAPDGGAVDGLDRAGGTRIDAERREARHPKPAWGPRRGHRDRSAARKWAVDGLDEGVALLELDRRDVTECLVQPLVVEPADVLDGRELELRARAPHTVCDQLGFVAVHESFRQSVVQRVSDRAYRREHLMSSSTWV